MARQGGGSYQTTVQSLLFNQPGTYELTVPGGVTQATFHLFGAQGGTGGGSDIAGGAIGRPARAAPGPTDSSRARQNSRTSMGRCTGATFAERAL